MRITFSLLFALFCLQASGGEINPRQQIVIWDSAMTIRNKFTQADPLPATPKNWLAPVDYTAGRVHVRLEILEKPSNRDIRFRVQFFFPGLGGVHHAGPLSKPILKAGTYDAEYTFSEMWKQQEVSYARGIAKLMFTIYDPANNPIPDGTADTYPLKIHLTVTLLPKGTVYQHPNIFGDLDFDSLTHLAQVVTSVRQNALGQALHSAEAARNSKDTVTAEEASRAAAALRKYAADAQAEIEAGKAGDPLAACAALADLAKKFSESSAGQELTALSRKWLEEPATVKERDAAVIMDRINGVYKMAQKYGDPANPEIAKRCKMELDTIATAARQLNEKYADTNACRQSAALCQRLKIKL